MNGPVQASHLLQSFYIYGIVLMCYYDPSYLIFHGTITGTGYAVGDGSPVSAEILRSALLGSKLVQKDRDRELEMDAI